MNVLFTKTGLDLTQAGPQSLWVVAANCIMPTMFFHALTKTGMDCTAVITIGTNAPDYNNWIPETVASELEAGEAKGFPITNAKKVLSMGEEIFVNVITPCNGTLDGTMYGVGFNI